MAMATTHDEQLSPFGTASRNFSFDFNWAKFRTLIHDAAKPQASPVYMGDFKCLTLWPKVFLNTGDGKERIATATLHSVHINANLELRGRNIELHAAKKLNTHYVYDSYAFSKDPKLPVTMTWIANANLKWWHFNLLDENQMPIARYSVDWWALKKFAKLEIMSPYAQNEKQVEEIVATIFTTYMLMLLRMNNIFQLIGAAFHNTKKTGKEAQVDPAQLAKAADQDWQAMNDASAQGKKNATDAESGPSQSSK